MKKIIRYRNLLLFIIVFLILLIEHWGLYKIKSKPVIQEDVMDEFTYDMNLVDQIFTEIQCFPVVKEENENQYPVTFENSWGSERTYGGERTHEGCDLMGVENERGKYKVCSMTNGVVKNIGWLEQGGWRIGIQSDSGIYYYYAHLDSYEKAFEEGEPVVAGQILGRMGDSGYGKEPGTKGMFDVHLHVGIYVKDGQGKERAINPYWYLKQLEIS